MRRVILAFLLASLLASPAVAQPGNLLRNADFQDDWITLLPETKNHHWCFPSEFFNRRDYNPDGWTLKGNWEWQNADAPPGERRLILNGPAEVVQRVNWVMIHDDRQLDGFPDAGGYPVMKAARSKQPEKFVRSLVLTVVVSGKDVPKGGGTLELGYCPPGATSTSDAMGTMVTPTYSVTAPLPEGTYALKIVELKLSGDEGLQAILNAAAKDPKEKAESAKSGTAIPAVVLASIRYSGKSGSVRLIRASLDERLPGLSPNLLRNGGFEDLDTEGYPAGWSRPQKYRYFPPRHYYIFNTWHNTNFPNRGFAAADALMTRVGKHTLRMIVPPGDEMMVLSDPIKLDQTEADLIEATALVKTDRLCQLQIDATDEKGQRLDCFNVIHKAPVSIGTSGPQSWQRIRQVFRPRTPVKSVRLALCARGVNGYTLDDTSEQPQNNVVGTVWWDDVTLAEPEQPRRNAPGSEKRPAAPHAPLIYSPFEARVPFISWLELGDRLLGANRLVAGITNLSPNKGEFTLIWVYESPSGKKAEVRSKPVTIDGFTGKDGESRNKFVVLPYVLSEPCPTAYTHYRGKLTLLDGKGKPVASSELWFGTWTTPIDIDLGALYLRPEQKQFVRMNLGLTQATLAKLKSVRLDVVRRGTGEVLKTLDVDATPQALAQQRKKIPDGLRDDFANLLLTDLDVSFLPVQPFADPQRNWFVRASAIGTDGKAVFSADSQPFCRLAHDAPQPPIQSVAIKGRMVHVNDKPWMPFGVTYGHTPVYDGPADPGAGKYRDLANLPGWSMYDRHNSASSNRKDFDFNCMRYVAGSIIDFKTVDARWEKDNLYCSSAFVVPGPVFGLPELFKTGGGQNKLDANLVRCKASPMIVSVAPGIEEAFGLFQGATPAQLKGMEQAVEYVRKVSGKPVMVGHGGYWNRLEFEKAQFFDIFDPETEPLYPANLHTDLTPLLADKDKAIWLRPQMYESVPYERWRFHTFVELMRGCRGWQIAHGPGDASLFRGLHGELEFFKPIVASADAGPKVTVEPWLEHWSRRHQGKTYVIAASTRGMPLGKWQWTDDAHPGGKRSRLTHDRSELRDESNAYGIGAAPETGPASHGIQYLPNARAWPAGTKLVQWVKLDAADPPKGLTILLKADGRWTHAGGCGAPNLRPLRDDPKTAYWFLNTFYRHAKGFLGWGTDLVPKSLDYIPGLPAEIAKLPKPGQWTKLEVKLESLGAANKLLDGVGFLHDGGKVWWGHTSLVDPSGKETLIWGDSTELPADRLAEVRITVEGLKAGTKVRVLFEDRELTADDGGFVDDFRGRDLYQRHGGGSGYGDAPVALHLYEIKG